MYFDVHYVSGTRKNKECKTSITFISSVIRSPGGCGSGLGDRLLTPEKANQPTSFVVAVVGPPERRMWFPLDPYYPCQSGPGVNRPHNTLSARTFTRRSGRFHGAGRRRRGEPPRARFAARRRPSRGWRWGAGRRAGEGRGRSEAGPDVGAKFARTPGAGASGGAAEGFPTGHAGPSVSAAPTSRRGPWPSAPRDASQVRRPALPRGPGRGRAGVWGAPGGSGEWKPRRLEG